VAQTDQVPDAGVTAGSRDPRTLTPAAGKSRALLALLPVALLGPAEILLFGPFATFSHNRSEFAVSFWTLAPGWLWQLPLVAIALGAAGVLLPRRAKDVYLAVLFALGLLVWAQGNLLVADYGPLQGERLDLERHAWRGWYEVALWGATLAAAAYFARRVASVAPIASGALLVVQTVVVGFAPFYETQVDTEPRSRPWSASVDRLGRLSHDRNVIHFVLDGFQSEVFARIVARERPTFDRDFSGFVFFPDHLGSFRTTKASMPAMLTGQAYANDVPFHRFRLRALRRQSIFSSLERRRYRIHSVSFHHGEHPPWSMHPRIVQYTIPTPYGSYRSYLRFASAQLLDLTLFRHVPHPAKVLVYDEDRWLLQRRVANESPGAAIRSFRAGSHVAFLDEFMARAAVVYKEPVYLFVHVALPHPPLVLDGDCGFPGQQPMTLDTYTQQARCTLVVVRRFLDRLRSLQSYDRSIILLTSDHGWNVPGPDHPLRGIETPAGALDHIGTGAMPILAIKPADGSGPMQTSYAPTSLTDIPATILDLLGLPADELPGTSAFRIDPNAPRRRIYRFHSWKNTNWKDPYYDVMYEFSVEGKVLDPSAWKFERTIAAPGSSAPNVVTTK
jgi:hypothetical protein